MTLRLGHLIVALLAAGCAAAPPAAPPAPPAPPAADAGSADAGWRWALAIDASSSASTLFVYRWRAPVPGGPRLPRIEAAPAPLAASGEPWSHKVPHGLSAYAGRPREAARSLAPLIDYALAKVPPAEHARTPLYLWASAGLRLLAPAERDEILREVGAFVAATPFTAAPPRVISGEEEGVYGWLTVNYLLGHLEHGGPFPTVGALDLGGASTQITFVPLDHPRRHGQVVRLGDRAYHLYTYSYLGRGQDVARDEMATPACFPRGYPLADGAAGTGDLEACRRAIRARLAPTCDEAPCSGLGAYQPPLYGEFLAFSVYAYTADFFALGGRLSPAELAAKGASFCAESWPERLARQPSAADDPYLPRYCFAAAYVVELLTEGFGFSPSSDRIRAATRVQGAETGWALGALLFELAGDAD